MGASTGGPSHIKKILNALPLNFDACIIIAQHMADTYIETFASHMDKTSN
ncbi:MAG: chemotaxis protein CheB, partial [Sulfurimonas sp.]|nr:chemotaxis protein CheB [Sulfurimonas sp.]